MAPNPCHPPLGFSWPCNSASVRATILSMIEVRPAVPADAGSIAEVHARSHREAYERLYGHGDPVPTAADRLMYWRHALGGPAPTVLATAKGPIVGFGHGTDDRSAT